MAFPVLQDKGTDLRVAGKAPGGLHPMPLSPHFLLLTPLAPTSPGTLASLLFLKIFWYTPGSSLLCWLLPQSRQALRQFP